MMHLVDSDANESAVCVLCRKQQSTYLCKTARLGDGKGGLTGSTLLYASVGVRNVMYHGSTYAIGYASSSRLAQQFESVECQTVRQSARQRLG